ncbi:MAG TPA: polyphosphate kinase 1 [Rectinemataceae bacterium]|nr:polyphosphate kinase 1 [Rectinemataceae bacterium]
MKTNRFLNRELSWLDFNARVLDEALDPSAPLLERLKFLAIVSSNFDEFHMVRMSALKAAAKDGREERDPAGMTAKEAISAISDRLLAIRKRQYDCLMTAVLPAIAKEGIEVTFPALWSAAERRWLESTFLDSVFPLLTPLALVEGEEFPCSGNLRVHVAFVLEGGEAGGNGPERRLAVVQVPPNLDRFIRLPSDGRGMRLALLDDLVEAFGSRLFPGWKVRESIQFKVIRDADAGVDEDRDEDFVTAMEEILAGRQNSWPVRLVIADHSRDLADRLAAILGLGAEDVTRVEGPVELRHFMDLASAEALGGAPAFARLRYEPKPPLPALQVQEGSTIWEEIARADRLLHVPYQSFDPVLRFIDAAADDPQVLAIKMTLYRTSGNSPIVRALTRAARNGKQVAVVMELKARFDEERNIAWASRLEQAGAIVTCGVARLKVHAKAALVVRREEGGAIRRYLHLSTGNYNDRTARLYVDLSLFTCNEELCRDASAFFNLLTGYSAVQGFARLVAAPFELKRRIIALIDREAARSTPESPGLIEAKLNALADPEVIEALYRASAAGVVVRLNVRGVCLLVPGRKGLSENISVISVVGRWLEHSRVIRFRNGGAEEIYLSSADWMPRNLEKRVELMFPILDPALRAEIVGILDAYFRDEAKARRLGPEGTWSPPPRRKGGFSAQDEFYEVARRRSSDEDDAPKGELQVRRLPGSAAW